MNFIPTSTVVLLTLLSSPLSSIKTSQLSPQKIDLTLYLTQKLDGYCYGDISVRTENDIKDYRQESESEISLQEMQSIIGCRGEAHDPSNPNNTQWQWQDSEEDKIVAEFEDGILTYLQTDIGIR